MNLEQNNLNAQIALMKDIIQNDHNIMYHILSNAKELMGILQQKKVDNNEPIKTRMVSFTNEQFEKMTDIVSVLGDESRHELLGIMAEKAVPDNKIKKEILSILQKP